MKRVREISVSGSSVSRTALAGLLLALLSACGGDSPSNTDSGEPDTDTATDSDNGSDGDSHTHTPQPSAAHYGDEFWANLAQGYQPFEKPDPPLGAAYGAEDLQYVGSWGAVVDWPLIATGAANLPDGRVVGWSSQAPDAFTGKLESTHGTLYDPLTHAFTPTNSTNHDMFCAGVSMLEDGSVFIAGGGQTITETSLFSDGEFNLIDPMNLSRWYPTSTTLASGQVLTSLGTLAAPWSELWTENEGWDLMPNVNLENVLEDESIPYRDWYPALNVAPDGSLFHSGPMPELFSVHLQDEDSVHSHGIRNGDDHARLYNTSVMYDVGKMLFAGGGDQDTTNAAYVMDVNGTTVITTPTEPMKHYRAMQNSVVLPNGEVLVIGGNTSGIQFSDDGTVLEPEVWNPDSGQWRVMAPHDRPRNYHSTALLLKDGRVLAAGGGLCGGCPTNHQNGEIFTPPYLYDALGELKPRPQITSGATEAYPGDSIELQGSDDMVSFNMLRLVAITHHHTTDQRLVPANFVRTGTGNYRLDLHSNGNVLVPGYYWIFGLDANGTPSEGHTIQIRVAAENQASTGGYTLENVAYEYYEETWSPLKLPDFDQLTPVATGYQKDFSLSAKQRNNQYGFRFNASLSVPQDGEYTFHLASDDGSRLFIDGDMVVDNDGAHPLEGSEKQGKINLSAGEHEIQLLFFEATGGDALLLSWQGPGFDKRPVMASDLGASPSGSANTPTGTLNQVNYAYYEGDWSSLPEFSQLTPVKQGTAPGFSLDARERDDFYGFRYSAILTVATAGNYKFLTTSDDGGRLSIDGTMVVNNDGLHRALTRQGTIALSPGNHQITVDYFERTGGDSLLVEWKGPGIGRSSIPLNLLSSIAVDSGSADGNGSDSAGDGSTDSTDGTSTGDGGSSTGSDGTGDGGDGGDGAPGSAGTLSYRYLEGSFETLSDLTSAPTLKSGTSAGFDLSARDRDEDFGFVFTGYLDIPATGNYKFFLKSDDGSRLSIGGNDVVTHDGLHAATQKRGVVDLQAGLHEIRLEYFEHTGAQSLAVLWAGPGIGKQPIPLGSLYAEQTGTTTGSGSSDGQDSAGAGDTGGDSGADSGSDSAGDGDTDSGSGSDSGNSSDTSAIRYEYYHGQWSSLPDFNALTPIAEGHQTDFALAQRTRDENYGFRFNTELTVNEAGQYTFYTVSDDGSALYVNDQLVVNNDGLHAHRQRSGKLTLPSGSHSIRIEFFERSGQDSLEVLWSGPGFGKQALHDAPLQSPGATDGGSDQNPSDPPSSTAGLQAEYYEGNFVTLPNFDSMSADDTLSTDNFELPGSNGASHYAYRFRGQLQIEDSGNHTFFVSSNDGSRLIINGITVVDNDGRHAVNEEQGSINLQQGRHDVELQYFQAGGSEALDVFWQSNGFTRTRISDDLLFQP